MTADALITLLETRWKELPEKLGAQWNDFYGKFCAIVGELPEKPTRRDMEKAADGLFELLPNYPYTKELLTKVHREPERLLINRLKDESQVRQLGNRLRTLVQQESGESSPVKSPPEGTGDTYETPSTNAGKGK